jgi:hypothetical protein
MRRYFEKLANSSDKPKLATHVCENRARATRLLQYCLSDLILGCPPDTDGGEQYKSLCGLPIVPTAEGGYQTIRPALSAVAGERGGGHALGGGGGVSLLGGGQSKHESKEVWSHLLVTTVQESELLLGMQREIVDPALPSCVLDHLTSDAMAAYTNVKVVTPEVLAACFLRVLPDGWKGVEEVQWRVGNDRQPDAAWMRLFWEVSLSHCLFKSMS